MINELRMVEERVVRPAEDVAATDSKIEKVREILFGSQIRELETHMDQMEDRLSKEIAQMREHHDAQLALLESFVRMEFKALSQRYQRIVEDLDGGLQATEEIKEEVRQDLAGRIENLDRRRSEVAREVHGRFGKQVDDLLDKLGSIRGELMNLVVRGGYKLLEDKTIRDALAAILADLFREGKLDLAKHTKSANSIPEISRQERERMITEAAYLRAKRRGFTGGSAEQDWREAEAEIDRVIEMAMRLADGESKGPKPGSGR
jgi:hypothetical protein